MIFQPTSPGHACLSRRECAPAGKPAPGLFLSFTALFWFLVPCAFAGDFFRFDPSGPDQEIILGADGSPNVWPGVSADLGSFDLDIFFLPDGTTGMDPAWAGVSGEVPHDLMEIPPRLRLSAFGGWFTAELALSAGGWHTLVSLPPDAVFPPDGHTPVRTRPAQSADTAPASEPVITKHSTGRLTLHLDARRDTQTARRTISETKQTPAPEAFMTMHTAAAYARQSRAKVIEIILEPGTYLWADFGEQFEEIILTPLGDVHIYLEEPDSAQPTAKTSAR